MKTTEVRAATLAGLWVGIAAVMAVVLFGMGRSLWCRCGQPVPWSFDIWSEHNSQHLFDPYSFTHFQHGLVFFALLWPLSSRAGLLVRFAIATLLEGAWEIFENTDRVIEHYRESTISLDYYGDSILNSVSDVLMCALGFLLSHRSPWWLVLGLFVGIEVTLVLTIRDSLLLNVLMLLAPLDAVKSWQSGALSP